MAFAEILKDAREAAGLTQEELSGKSGVALHSIQAWEAGNRPNSLAPIRELAAVLNTTPKLLLSTFEWCVVAAYEKGGANAAREFEILIEQDSELFTDPQIDDREKDGVILALYEAYWIAKQRNQKYTPKK